MRRLFLIAATAFVALTAVLIVRAQEGDDDMSALLPITADVRYQVGVGDTLDSIAALFDVSLECLLDTNAEIIEQANLIFPGDVLDIRAACPRYTGLDRVAFPRPVEDEGVGGGGGSYVVRAGDTLDTIAFAFDVSVISLQESNEIENANEIQVGQVLEIPADAPPYGQVPPPAGVNIDPEQGGVAEGFDPTAGEIYVIQPRDTIDTLGAFYNKDVTCILETNNITQPQRLQPRTVIFIPDACPEYSGLGISASRILPADSATEVVPTVGVIASATPDDAATEEVAGTSTPTTIVVPTITPTQEVLPAVTEEAVGTGGVVEATPTFTPVTIETEEATVSVATVAPVTATQEEIVPVATEEADDAPTATATIAFTATPTVTIEPTEGAATEEVEAAASPTLEVLDDASSETGNIIDTLEGLDIDS